MIAAAVVLTVGGLIVRELADERIDDFEACSIGDAPECDVSAPPCAEAGSRDLNPGNRAVPPRAGTPRRPGGPLPYGFNDSAGLVGAVTLEQDLALQEAAGSSIWRLPLDWGAAEPEPNEFDFSASDEAYCTALEHRIDPQFHLTGVPPWALNDDARPCSEAPCVQPPAPEHDDALRRFSELAAIRYPAVAAIEAWNEPNFRSFWPSPDPARYAEVLAAIYEGVKDGAPKTIVLGGAVTNSPKDDPETGSLSLSTFLSEIFAAGAAEHMDALSIHAYPIGLLGTEGDLFTPQVAEAQRLASAAAPDRELPLWVTEIGMPTVAGGFAPAVSEQDQAGQMVRAYGELEADPNAAAVLFHTLLDPGPEIPGGPGFGWFTAPTEGQVRPKPIVCAFRRLDAPNASCPATFQLD